MNNPEQRIKVITRSPGQHTATLALHENIEHVSVEADLEDRSLQDFRNCCFVFDDMLDGNQKLIDPFLLGKDNNLDVYY